MKLKFKNVVVGLVLAPFFLFATQTLLAQSSTGTQDDIGRRHLELIYSGTIRELPPESKVRIWVPVAPTTSDQEVLQMTSQLLNIGEVREEGVHGNRMLFVELPKDHKAEFPFELNYEIRRNEIRGLANENDTRLREDVRQKYLRANRLVPVTGRPLELLQGIRFPADQLASVRELYNRVEGYMAYDKSQPGYGNGDVLWACDSKTGNCTDFHSLFMSLARSRLIPAYFEIGFPLPAERGQGTIGGYHCWAYFFLDGKGWIPVDISEADKHPEMKDYYFGNLTENRISFSTGRDIVLEPAQEGSALNYFVYPYVEVDGKPWPKENTDLDFRYRDVENKN